MTPPAVVFSLRPRFAEAIISAAKTVEVRRSFSKRWLGMRAVLYATTPVRAVVGSATIASVERLSVAGLWHRHASAIGVTREELEAYAEGRASLYAIGLGRVRKLATPLPLSAVRSIDPGASPPRSYAAVGPDSAWALALARHRPLRAG